MNKMGELLSSINHSYRLSIKFDNNSAIDVAGKVMIEVLTKHGIKKMNDVYHTIDMAYSLLSVGRLWRTTTSLRTENVKFLTRVMGTNMLLLCI